MKRRYVAVLLVLVAAFYVAAQPGPGPYLAWYNNGVLLINRYLGRLNVNCHTGFYVLL